MFKLPEGEYTLAIEVFPPSTTNLSVSVVSTSLNINQQATKLFVNYSRSIVHLHKWSITQSTASSPTQGIGHMIVYGVKGSQNDVGSSVYDTAYVIENGKIVMQTDLDMNVYRLLNSVRYIHGILNTNNGNTFLLNGCDKIIMPVYSPILSLKALYFNVKSSYQKISSKIKHSFFLNQPSTYSSFQATQLQTINVNLELTFPLMAVELASDIKDGEFLLLIEYRVP